MRHRWADQRLLDAPVADARRPEAQMQRLLGQHQRVALLSLLVGLTLLVVKFVGCASIYRQCLCQ
jgi:hypothetical protein